MIRSTRIKQELETRVKRKRRRMIASRAAKVRGAELEGGGATELQSSASILMMAVTMPLVFATT